jgi:hypothetical protein
MCHYIVHVSLYTTRVVIWDMCRYIARYQHPLVPVPSPLKLCITISETSKHLTTTHTETKTEATFDEKQLQKSEIRYELLCYFLLLSRRCIHHWNFYIYRV